MFGLDTFEVRMQAADGSMRVVKLGLQQSRLTQLTVSLPAGPPAGLLDEVDALVSSFEVYPLNLGCLRASNEGPPPPTICY